MIIRPAASKQDRAGFFGAGTTVYRGNKCHRSTEDDVVRLLVAKKSSFHTHATVTPYVVLDDGEYVGRFALVNDYRLKDYVQISFFEALPGLDKLIPSIEEVIRTEYTGCSKIVAGLNGHLNYGAGFLLNRFDLVPVFGLPYTHEYYKDYFEGYRVWPLVSYRFSIAELIEFGKSNVSEQDYNGISVRCMDKKELDRDVAIYTYLNNSCFAGHPFWADRSVEEDLELFRPFRHLLNDENLVFAEKDGKPIGFLLWYPDFNELVSGDRTLGVFDVIKFRLSSSIRTFRYAEIAVLPQYRTSHATLALLHRIIPYLDKHKFRYGEGGFIFEENRSSLLMTKRFLERVFGTKFEPYRRYALYEKAL